MADAYKTAVKGSLKLKGVQDGGVKKKRKTKATPKETTSADASSSPQPESPPKTQKAPLTEFERTHEEKQRKLRAERIERMAKQSHKEKVAQFNRKLASTSEHFDMPRIGPG